MGALTLPLEIQKVYVTLRPTTQPMGQFCQEHGLEYTTVNPPKELTEAVEQAVDKLIQAQADEIHYYLED